MQNISQPHICGLCLVSPQIRHILTATFHRSKLPAQHKSSLEVKSTNQVIGKTVLNETSPYEAFSCKDLYQWWTCTMPSVLRWTDSCVLQSTERTDCRYELKVKIRQSCVGNSCHLLWSILKFLRSNPTNPTTISRMLHPVTVDRHFHPLRFHQQNERNEQNRDSKRIHLRIFTETAVSFGNPTEWQTVRWEPCWDLRSCCYVVGHWKPELGNVAGRTWFQGIEKIPPIDTLTLASQKLHFVRGSAILNWKTMKKHSFRKCSKPLLEKRTFTS